MLIFHKLESVQLFGLKISALILTIIVRIELFKTTRRHQQFELPAACRQLLVKSPHLVILTWQSQTVRLNKLLKQPRIYLLFNPIKSQIKFSKIDRLFISMDAVTIIGLKCLSFAALHADPYTAKPASDNYFAQCSAI